MRKFIFVQASIFFAAGSLFASCIRQDQKTSEPTNRMGEKEHAMNNCAMTLEAQKLEGCFDRVLRVPICEKTCVFVGPKKFHCGVKMEEPVEDTSGTLCTEKNTWNPTGGSTLPDNTSTAPTPPKAATEPAP
jgi:hypothetical protein